MRKMNALFLTLDKKPKALADQKAIQMIGSCTVKSVENELKAFILSNANTREDGHEIYKTIKSLMISHSKEETKTQINAYLTEMLNDFENFR